MLSDAAQARDRNRARISELRMLAPGSGNPLSTWPEEYTREWGLAIVEQVTIDNTITYQINWLHTLTRALDERRPGLVRVLVEDVIEP
jgi:hypothetical protein